MLCQPKCISSGNCLNLILGPDRSDTFFHKAAVHSQGSAQSGSQTRAGWPPCRAVGLVGRGAGTAALHSFLPATGNDKRPAPPDRLLRLSTSPGLKCGGCPPHAACRDMDNVIFLFLETTILLLRSTSILRVGVCLAHGQSESCRDGGRKSLVALIPPANPACARHRGWIDGEGVIVCAGVQMLKALPDGAASPHAGKSRRLNGFCSPYLVVRNGKSALPRARRLWQHIRLSIKAPSGNVRPQTAFLLGGMMYCHCCGKIGRSS